MNKLLHELLRDAAISDDSDGGIIYGNDYAVSYKTNEECNSLADEIERCYTPNPRFEDGEPVSKGCEVDGGTVDFWTVWSNGSWELYDADGDVLQCGEADDRVEPRPAIMSADGKVLDEGMTVWVTPEHRGDCGRDTSRLGFKAGLYGYSFGDAAEVRNVVRTDRIILSTDDRAWCPASWLTTEPVVLDADGVEFKVGETVWHVDSGEEYVVVALPELGCYQFITVEEKLNPGYRTQLNRCKLTHREPDSIERIMDDAKKNPYAYYNDHIGHNAQLQDEDTVIQLFAKHLIKRTEVVTMKRVD